MAKTHPSYTVNTTFATKDIRTAASVYTFTAAATARVSFTVKLTNAAGSGDYVAYLTHDWLGGGAAATVLPKTTATAAAGETVIEFVTIQVDVANTDVVNVMIDGLAGDSSVNGAIRIVADNPSVFEATDTVSTVASVSGDVVGKVLGGGAGVLAGVGVQADMQQMDGSTTPVDNLVLSIGSGGYIRANLMQILGTTLTETSGRIAAAFKKFFNVPTPTGTLNSLPDAVAGTSGGLAIVGSEMGLANDAITAGKFDESTAFPLKSADTGSTKVARVGADSDTLETLSDQLDAIQLVTDALDVSEVTQVATSNAGHLTITAGLTYSGEVSGLTIPADWVTAIWTMKNSVQDLDPDAVVQLRATNPAAVTDGLQRLNAAAPVSPIVAASGTLEISQALGKITVVFSDEMTTLLPERAGYGWDVKFVDSTGRSSGRRGTADVVPTETDAIL